MNLCGSYVLYLCETLTKNIISPFITLYVIQPGILLPILQWTLYMQMTVSEVW